MLLNNLSLQINEKDFGHFSDKHKLNSIINPV